MFLAGNTYGIFIFLEFLESSAPDPEKPSLDRIRPGSVNPPKAKEVFPARKSLISDIPGFPARNDEHSLTFLTVWDNIVLGRQSFARHWLQANRPKIKGTYEGRWWG
jgi:hypothetical protein